MKVIFLDIDGVLNVDYCGHDDYGNYFNYIQVNNLKHIIEKTDAKIVISSSWRFSGLHVMKSMWEYRKLPGEVIDITPFEVDLVYKGFFKYYDEVSRGDEIQWWINTYKPENYVIIDDVEDFLDNQLNNFVKTKENIGLTKKLAEEAIEILNK